MKHYLEQLKDSAEDSGNILCMGIDPVLEKIPIKKEPEGSITNFYLDIFDGIDSEGLSFPTVKPNMAYFEQYGFEGLRALKSILEKAKQMKFQVLLDAKRGDIGETAKAYSNSVFKFWKADAVTIHPYLGSDSIFPFLEDNKGAYVQVRNSNPSAADMQELKIDGKKLFNKVSELVVNKWHRPGLGAVVGATYPKELEELSEFFVNSSKEIPLLIPGVGSQGGSAEEVIEILKKTDNPLWLHRINSSSGISYAYLNEKSEDYVGCAMKEIRILAKKLEL